MPRNLILKRRLGERICIGSDIVVTVLGWSRSQVKLGIQAPEHIAVDREEVRRAKGALARATIPTQGGT